ncbi:hypothetical protein P7K49_032564 [Saguinus oedipus]|uniref:Uncharacterized protein n=1 Tax=Saguinus oedipus TaxID=9490 RepID=A0ABQ9TYL0_SAGOE|nr:hypothetical protein P7K49_032564 [Saguinus oedipus]
MNRFSFLMIGFVGKEPFVQNCGQEGLAQLSHAWDDRDDALSRGLEDPTQWRIQAWPCLSSEWGKREASGTPGPGCGLGCGEEPHLGEMNVPGPLGATALAWRTPQDACTLRSLPGTSGRRSSPGLALQREPRSECSAAA